MPPRKPSPSRSNGGAAAPAAVDLQGLFTVRPFVRRSLSILLAAVLGLVLLGFAASFPWSSAANLQEPLLFLGALLVWTLSPILQAVRFGYLLARRSSRPPLGFLVQLHLAERFFAPVLPFRLSLLVKAYLLQRGGGVETGTGFSVTVLDALFESSVVLAIAVLGAPLLVRTPLYLLGLVALGLAAAFFLIAPERLKAWEGRLQEGGRLARAVRFLHDLRLQTGALLRDPGLLLLLPFLAGAQLILVVTGDLLLRSVGYSLPWSSLLVILNAAALLGNATAIPSGWGAREVALVGLLSPAGIPLGSALLFSVLLRAVTLPQMALGYGLAVRLGWESIVRKRSPSLHPPGVRQVEMDRSDASATRFPEAWREEFIRVYARNPWQEKRRARTLRWNSPRADAVHGLVRRFLPPTGASVLEVGCWVGWNLIPFASHRAIGLDLDGRGLRMGRRLGLPADLVQGDGTRLPLRDASVDLVICHMVIEHIPPNRWAAFSRELARVLRPGGTLYMSAPNFWWPVEDHYRLPALHWLPSRLRNVYVRGTGRDDACSWFFRIPTHGEVTRLLEPFFRVKDVTGAFAASPYARSRFLLAGIGAIVLRGPLARAAPSFHLLCTRTAETVPTGPAA